MSLRALLGWTFFWKILLGFYFEKVSLFNLFWIVLATMA